ncbi:hypothetical protein [Actinoplanes couchii]|nr:hypothetical protein [Actinoplanes couchii]MDR6322369.1 hypothetical protein [Actinoplanes couchii]
MRKTTRGLVTACAGLVIGAAFGAGPAMAGPEWVPPGRLLGYYDSFESCSTFATSLVLWADDYDCDFFPARIVNQYALVIERPVQILPGFVAPPVQILPGFVPAAPPVQILPGFVPAAPPVGSGPVREPGPERPAPEQPGTGAAPAANDPAGTATAAAAAAEPATAEPAGAAAAASAADEEKPAKAHKKHAKKKTKKTDRITVTAAGPLDVAEPGADIPPATAGRPAAPAPVADQPVVTLPAIQAPVIRPITIHPVHQLGGPCGPCL